MGTLTRQRFKDREAWLLGRREHKGIGASEAAGVVGLSNWTSPTRLWREKRGLESPKDLSDNEHVRFGSAAEEHLRALFMLEHPELGLSYHAFDFLFQAERPWLRCTLDGELLERASLERGILEVKTAELISREDRAAWDGRIPDHYLCQVLHQFLATGFDFAYVYAMLRGPDGRAELRTYYFRKEHYKKDIEWLLEQEEKFWLKVETGAMPGAILRL